MADEATTTDTTTTTAGTDNTAVGTTTLATTTGTDNTATSKADAERIVADQKAAADKATADAAKATDFSVLKMPEGYKTDDPVFADAVKMFGDLKIAPEGAQKLLDFTVERDKAMAKAVNDGNAASWIKQADGWKAETAKKYSAEDLGIAKTAFAKVFDPETAKYLEGLRYTDHPGFVAAMVKIGKAIKDDTFVSGNAVNGVRDARAQFPNSNMNP